MLQYPKEYNLLNEEELEYTGGGSDADFMLRWRQEVWQA